MKSIKYISLAAILVLAACGGSKNDLAAKKEELNKLKSQIAALQSEAKKLENEIAKLEPPKETGKLVETSELTEASFRSYLVIDGKADADQNTIATSQVPATVTSILVRAGDHVGAGQTLAYLDNATLKQSRLQLEQQLAFANTVYDKQKRLWEQGVGTEIQFLTAKNQKEALEKNLATLDAQLAMYVVKSPISGTIESVDTKIGQVAAPGYPLFKVVNLSQLKVVADVAESFAGKLKTGDIALIEFPDLKKNVESKISFTSKLIDPVNRTFRIEINIPSSGDIKPNMIAKLKIVQYSNPKAIAVPTNCVQSSENGTYVVIAEVKNGKNIATRKSVKTGHIGENTIEILEGLAGGEKLIVTGFQELNDGQEITLSNPTAEQK